MNVIIIGKNSYIGDHIDYWLQQYGHNVSQLDVLSADWENFDYSGYDAIIHVAGIVHRPDCKDWNLYKKVNTDMPITIATKAKLRGVKQYIYFSTMGVYGIGKKLEPCVVTKDTPLLREGNSMYGASKLMAEDGLAKLQDADFSVAFVRPPSVYGKGCKGGYISGFRKIVELLPIVPEAYTDIHQSFIYIDNLAECIRMIVENKLSGVFCPQDDMIPNANELLKAISDGIGKKYRSSRLLGMCMRLFCWLPLVKKAYGGAEYARELSDIPGKNYAMVSFVEGMKRTVGK